MEHVAVRNAESGTHTADGWARATGKVGVSIGTSGLAGTEHDRGARRGARRLRPDHLPHRVERAAGQAERSAHAATPAGLVRLAD
ncbi:hypothetical protein [Pseudonocardia aurantiaca]|uniref:Uncharacterized protein n=1 Tax=Pseudonocardia aurantiaca TaxID=75290 RepID=A0ABW4FK70_9PSEU